MFSREKSEIEKEDKEFGVVTERGNGTMYLSLFVNNAKIKVPLKNNSTIAELHDSTQDFMKDLLSLPGVEEVFKKHGAIIQRNQ